MKTLKQPCLYLSPASKSAAGALSSKARQTNSQLLTAGVKQSYLSFNSYSAGIALSRQNLTSVDVRFWRLKSIPAL